MRRMLIVDLTGTIYPIPLPKGGKNSNDIILREDQLLLMGGRQNKWNWKKPEVYDKESVEFFGHSIKANSGFKYGPACKNPNQKDLETDKKKLKNLSIAYEHSDSLLQRTNKEIDKLLTKSEVRIAIYVGGIGVMVFTILWKFFF